MADQEKHYFARGNTADGLYTLFDSVLSGLDTVFVLQGRAGTAVSAFLTELAGAWSHKGWSLHYIHHPLNRDWLEGLILKEFGIGVVDGNAWSSDPVLEGTEIRLIDLQEVVSVELLNEHASEIEEADRQTSALYKEAYDTFQKTLRIHDEWETFYIQNLDLVVMDRIAEEWAEEHLVPIRPARSHAVHRFLGAATWEGAVDYVLNLTDDLETRVFVKGRPGSGKSTLFKRLAKAAEQRGVDTEIYHCGFDPNSLDMIIFPQQSLAIFDSTAPHEHFPSREGDEILDVYELAITPGTDERFEDQIAEIRARYSRSMKEAIALLATVREVQEPVLQIYERAVDLEAIRRLAGGIQAEVDALTNSSVIGD
ncbi:hypothetical protein WMW72_19175 [Paenibacillus filicis]|uniref:Nucleotide kinase n=1 Tax=Paenibacillus filicis TaxID=669464 RepID=A0ABU9DMF6_9BACL